MKTMVPDTFSVLTPFPSRPRKQSISVFRPVPESRAYPLTKQRKWITKIILIFAAKTLRITAALQHLSLLTDLLLQKLLGEQRALHLTLGEQHADLAALYLGAVTVVRHDDNPERIPQAAFSIRELLVKLPNHLDVPMPAHRERLGDRIDGLKKCWDSVMKNTASRQNGTWTGSIDSHLEKLLTELECLFKWRDEHHPRRRDEVAALLRRLDPAGGKLPRQLESENYKEWSGLSEFFNNVLHHNITVGIKEFQEKLTTVERLLLDRLRPRTFVDWQTIDDIIREGESHD